MKRTKSNLSPNKGQNDKKIGENSVFKGRLAKRAKEALEEHKGSPQWLQKSINFSHDLKLNTKYDGKINELFIQLGFGTKTTKKEQKLIDLNILVANLLRRNGRRPVRISLDRNDWTKSIYNKASYFIRAIINAMEEVGYIKMEPGYKNNESDSFKTRIWPSQKLIDFFNNLPVTPDFIEYEPKQLVELRKFQGRYRKKPTVKHPQRKYKKLYEPVEYKETQKSYKVRKILQRVNEINKNADIKYKAGRRSFKINTSIVATYVEDFSHYGRLHSRGLRNYQSMDSKTERSTITINGNPTVELDFSALHPNLLYAAKGIQWPLDKDCYSQVHSHPFVRPFLKIILLTMLNAESFNDAQAASNEWYIKKNLNNDEIIIDDDEITDTHRKRLKSIGIHKAGPLIRRMEEVHQPIANFFYKKAGLKLMNKDAAIALNIVDHFAKKNIPILPVHDSFIVEEKHGNELRKIMHQTYSKHTKGYRIKVS